MLPKKKTKKKTKKTKKEKKKKKKQKIASAGRGLAEYETKPKLSTCPHMKPRLPSHSLFHPSGISEK